VPIFLERFVLPMLAAGVIAVIVLNPFKFDWHQRAGLLLVVVGLAYFAARTVQLENRTSQALSPSSPVGPPSIPSSLPAPVVEQKATDSTCSNVVAGKDAKIDCSAKQENGSGQKNPKSP
jgi:hypothetical protein